MTYVFSIYFYFLLINSSNKYYNDLLEYVDTHTRHCYIFYKPFHDISEKCSYKHYHSNINILRSIPTSFVL